jgi:catechol 2,3-dioxygenase-like lactoylglutathione lyase family enzyme
VEPRLSLLTLGVRDVARARKFYEALGFVASGPSGDDVEFFPAGGCVLALHGRTAVARDAGLEDSEPGFAGVSIAHNVRSEAEVAQVLDEAVAAGARLLKAAHKVFWGGTVGYFTDPDGHLWEVAYNPGFPLDAAGNIVLPEPKPAP